MSNHGSLASTANASLPAGWIEPPFLEELNEDLKDLERVECELERKLAKPRTKKEEKALAKLVEGAFSEAPAGEDGGNFELECSDFQYVSRGEGKGKALRFTVTWKFEHGRYGLLGMSEEGWLCTRNKKGELRVSPPINRFGPLTSKQLKTITVELHDLILSMLENHRTVKTGVSYVDYVGKDVVDSILLKSPEHVDPEFAGLEGEVRV